MFGGKKVGEKNANTLRLSKLRRCERATARALHKHGSRNRVIASDIIIGANNAPCGARVDAWLAHGASTTLSNTHFRFNQSENIFLPARCEKQSALFYSRNNSGDRMLIFILERNAHERARPTCPRPPLCLPPTSFPWRPPQRACEGAVSPRYS